MNIEQGVVNIATDVYRQHGAFGLIGLLVVFNMLADRFPMMKFWMWKSKHHGLAAKLQTNHIPHIETKLAVMCNEIKNLENKVDEVKESIHARISRLEERLEKKL